MGDNPPSSQTVLDWLSDYTHFICNQFGVPHNQANGLLQQYLNLKAQPPTLESVMSPYEQPATYPDLPTPQHHTFVQEQPASAHLAVDFQKGHLGNQASLSPHDTYTGEETNQLFNNTAATTHNETSPGLSLPDNEQSGNTMIDPSFLETNAPSLQLNQPVERISIGSIKDYDPFWVQHDNVDPSTVENFHSSMKFDDLMSNEIIKFGDVLTFLVLVSINGQSKETEAHLKIINSSQGASVKQKRYPYLSVELPSDRNRQFPIAKSCKGTKAMIEHLQTTCDMAVLRSGWRDIQVFRGQQALGSLWWVKQTFHLWRDSKDREAQEKGQHFRNRRPQLAKGNPDGFVHHNGRVGLWQNGVFVPDSDQNRFLPKG